MDYRNSAPPSATPPPRRRIERPPAHLVGTDGSATAPRVLRAVKMRLGPARGTVAEVEVGVSGLRIVLLVAGPRVCWPLIRGEQAVSLDSVDLTAAVEALAIAAAEEAT
jgi:hypothetical protein